MACIRELNLQSLAKHTHTSNKAKERHGGLLLVQRVGCGCCVLCCVCVWTSERNGNMSMMNDCLFVCLLRWSTNQTPHTHVHPLTCGWVLRAAGGAWCCALSSCAACELSKCSLRCCRPPRQSVCAHDSSMGVVSPSSENSRQHTTHSSEHSMLLRTRMANANQLSLFLSANHK